MNNSKIFVSFATAAVILLAPVAAFATPVAIGGTGTHGAHSLSRMSSRSMMARKHMMMKKRMMMRKHAM